MHRRSARSLLLPLAATALPLALGLAISWSAAMPASGLGSNRHASPPAPAGGTEAQPGSQDRFAGLVDVGGRRLYLECLGSGTPTVVLEAGYGNRADIWSVDRLQPAGTRPMVLPAVAGFTRVCAYDRPGTVGQVNPDLNPAATAAPALPSRSDPVPMPRTAEDLVADLHALLGGANLPGPYVVVGHSLGGLVVRLYACTYPGEVAGLVLVDASHEDSEAQIKALLTPAQWAEIERLQQAPLEWYPQYELVDFDTSMAQMRQARVDRPLRRMPLAVLSRGNSNDRPLPDWPVEAFERMWGALQDDLATLVPNARHSIAAQSGHYIQQEQPALVIEAIRQVVAGVRDRDTWYDLVTCCQP
jgi:pimeloyl-ACP methyl ester carboxylesterase